jgi:hypothetical protein
MSQMGQSLHFDGRPATSDFTSTPDMSLHRANRREWDGPAVLLPRATDRIGSGALKHEEHMP